MRSAPFTKKQSEPTITLINVVFLMLIFFLIAGTLAPPLDPDLHLVETKMLEGREPPDALVITPEGATEYRGKPMNAEAYVALVLAKAESVSDKPDVRIVPDRALSATDLLRIGRELQQAGAAKVFIVTLKGLE